MIASPVAWYFMNQWLQDFAYRVDISGWEFALAAFGVISIALITVSFQAIKGSDGQSRNISQDAVKDLLNLSSLCLQTLRRV